MAKDVEERIFEVEVNGMKKRLTKVSGTVDYARGRDRATNAEKTHYEKVLDITILGNGMTEGRRFTFRGESPVTTGETATVGIMLDADGKESDVLYVGKFVYTGSLAHRPYTRVDYMHKVELSEKDMSRIVAWE